MANADFTTSIVVDQAPEDVFNSINNVRGWWSENIEGDTDRLNADFSYSYKDNHICKIRVTELIPGRKVTWKVLDNYFDFTKDRHEWKGSSIVFEISKKDQQTQVKFTHVGLNPGNECFDVCKDAWSDYIRNSLRKLITTGKGKPNAKEKNIASINK
jgi:hypothetical protein